MAPRIDLNNLKFEYEFPDTQGFECRPDMYCGNCCSMPFHLTYREINRINDFLEKWLYSKRFRNFVLDYLTYLRVPIRMTTFYLQKTTEKYRTAFETFFKPSFFIEKEGVLHVVDYRLSYHRGTQKCIFFNPMTYQCAIYNVRPNECRIYPFNFEYNFRINKEIKVFIIEKCEGLESTKPVNKLSLEKTIKDSMKFFFDHNKMLQKIGEKNNIPLHMPSEHFQKREIRKIHKEMPKMADWVEKIHISRKKNKIPEIQDILLEEQVVSCLNIESYRSYLSQLRKRTLKSNWI